MADITPIVMPKWGLSMKEGTINDWLVEEGTQITVGMPILDVETDKIANAVEAPDAGTLRRKVAAVGDILPVKALLGVLAPPEVSDADIDAFVAAYETPAADEQDEGAAAAAYQFIDVDGIRVRYAKRGEGADTVLFIHGFGGDLDNWLFNLDALADAHTVIALDLPAHGHATPRLPGTTLASLAGFVAHFMDALDIGQAHLVGHSMGGGVAAQLAVDAPQRVRSVALVELLFADAGLVSRQMLDDLLRYKRLDGVTEALGALGASLFGGGRQTELPGHRLGGTGKPVLVIWGAQDQIIPASHAANAPAGATVKVFDDAGHMSQMEKANEVNALLKRHIGG
ncbi:acetoin dehydrogenase E2 subunit dihydrolipoyllysine-residue acetyltransferase [Cupriavidus basilensis OR16]|uniref:Acetoin dehydrogenase E2 subunit dihydrolipoyllysine-residue acetyltransferase n=1 Tax=Cupriavidus basilensis OR16 TaxID=1127483 RepID=H1S2J6_9BURK|nr:acetoin dehydrogenase dihydrolipoyllysine-residue acetyltransferase subunit [Cupriavidus basilensis]EHP43244.1 acetoin dehydrogenase E2 subunit dihydrolipoyllysine-residue acetyltransferase [Cupriavidus basilensis OR16]